MPKEIKTRPVTKGIKLIDKRDDSGQRRTSEQLPAISAELLSA